MCWYYNVPVQCEPWLVGGGQAGVYCVNVSCHHIEVHNKMVPLYNGWLMTWEPRAVICPALPGLNRAPPSGQHGRDLSCEFVLVIQSQGSVSQYKHTLSGHQRPATQLLTFRGWFSARLYFLFWYFCNNCQAMSPIPRVKVPSPGHVQDKIQSPNWTRAVGQIL